MWNGISDPEIGKFSPWFCESPPWLLGEHRMGYKETDSGSTTSSQRLEGGEERISWQLHLPLAEDASGLIRTTQAFCPRFCPATSLERTKLKDKTRDGEPATRLDILLGQLLDGHTLATCIMHTHSATDDSIYLGTLDECASCLHQIIHYHHMSVLWFTWLCGHTCWSMNSVMLTNHFNINEVLSLTY